METEENTKQLNVSSPLFTLLIVHCAFEGLHSEVAIHWQCRCVGDESHILLNWVISLSNHVMHCNTKLCTFQHCPMSPSSWMCVPGSCSQKAYRKRSPLPVPLLLQCAAPFEARVNSCFVDADGNRERAAHSLYPPRFCMLGKSFELAGCWGQTIFWSYN